MPLVERGQVLIIKFDDAEPKGTKKKRRPPEMTKARPAVVVSETSLLQVRPDLVSVCPISLSHQDLDDDELEGGLHVPLGEGEGGCKRGAVVLCDQPYTVATSRVIDRIGYLRGKTMRRVDRRLAISLGLDVSNPSVEG